MKISVVIPSYKCKKHILDVIEQIPQTIVEKIYVIDDKCPEGTGAWVKENCKDSRVHVEFHEKNQGVGGAVLTGYLKALSDSMDIAVKIDGDGQMDPKLIEHFVKPILLDRADYTKGNRFSKVEHVKQMPTIRLIGNLGLSFISKMSTGYWTLLDPTNGYTAINLKMLHHLSIEKISRRYFFESDLLFRIGLIKGAIVDIPMESKYADEVSNLKISKSLFEFSINHFRNFFKRIVYQYYFLDFNLASIQLVFGLLLTFFGVTYGIYTWLEVFRNETLAPAGSIMLAALPIILGFQLLLGFLSFDMNKMPNETISKYLN